MTEILQDTNDPTGVDVKEFSEEEWVEQLKESKENIAEEEAKEEVPEPSEEELPKEEPSTEEEPREEDGGLIAFFDKNYSPIEEKEEPVETVESMLDSIDYLVERTINEDKQHFYNAKMSEAMAILQRSESFNMLEEEEKKQEIEAIEKYVIQQTEEFATQQAFWYKENVETNILNRFPEKERANISFVKNLVSKGKGNIDLKGARVIAKVVEDVYTKLREKETEINNKIASLEKKAKNKTEAYSESVGRNKGGLSLSSDELALCKEMGVDPKNYLKNKKVG